MFRNEWEVTRNFVSWPSRQPTMRPSRHPAEASHGAAPAPWREEALDAFSQLIDRGLRLHFVSNSSTAVIIERLKELLANGTSLADKISVQSDAGKFRVCELK